ncbi:hypothetical protein ACIGB6_19630 [Paeniglutamicibacter gangotriensis]
MKLFIREGSKTVKERIVLYPLALSLVAGLTLSGCAASSNEPGAASPASV